MVWAKGLSRGQLRQKKAICMFLSGIAEMVTSSTVRMKWMRIFANSMKCGWEECKSSDLPKQKTLERGDAKYDCARSKTL